jgi:hypothetical protein
MLYYFYSSFYYYSRSIICLPLLVVSYPILITMLKRHNNLQSNQNHLFAIVYILEKKEKIALRSSSKTERFKIII